MSTEHTKHSLFSPNIDEIKKVFNRFDTNNDGKISADELIHVMKSLGSQTLDEQQITQMMKNIDTDSDGFINLEEFTRFCRGNEQEQQDGGIKELREAFEMYDLNKNGLISATELHQILTRLGERCTVEDCVKMIKSVDSDGDGCVNFEEFKDMMATGGETSNGEGTSSVAV